MLTCTSTKKILAIRVGFSYEDGGNRRFGTRLWRKCNQAISRGKVGITGVCLNGTNKRNTNQGIYLLI